MHHRPIQERHTFVPAYISEIIYSPLILVHKSISRSNNYNEERKRTHTHADTYIMCMLCVRFLYVYVISEPHYCYVLASPVMVAVCIRFTSDTNYSFKNMTGS
jgi:hypothetical protein